MNTLRFEHVLSRLLAACLAAACTAGSALPSSAQVASPAGPQATAQTTGDAEGVLVLRNGQVFRGAIRREGDRLIVALQHGTITVRLGDVELRCRTLPEAYQLKRQRIGFGGAYEHLELAQWCQRQGLTREAVAELQAARALEPDHPLIGLVQRRIDASRQQPTTRSNAAEEPRSSTTPEELDLMVRGMPPGTMETFTRTIQPLLANSCTTTGCHGPGSTSKFHLWRAHPGRPLSRRVTQRNLHAALEFVDRENPSRSPLTQQPAGANGGGHALVFTGAKTAQYRDLVDWVYAVAQKRRSSRPAYLPKAPPSEQPPQGVRTAGHVSLDTGARSPFGPADSDPPPGGVVPAVVEEAAGRDIANPFQLPPDFRPPPRDAGSTAHRPVDPFDAEIFNRRYFEKPPAGATTPAAHPAG